MDLWELISHLCKLVVEEQNVYLDITVLKNGYKIQLLPCGDMFMEEDGEV